MISIALIYYLILPQTGSAHDRVRAGFTNDAPSDYCANEFGKLAGPHLRKDVSIEVETLNWDRLVIDEGTAVRAAAIKEIDEYNPAFRWNDIGQGNTGHVYRVTPPEGEAYVIKQYKNPGARELDRDSLEYIRSIIGRIESPTVEIVNAVDVGERSMRLTNIRGRDLEYVLEEAELGNSEKKSLIARWNQFVQDFYKEVGPTAPSMFKQPFEDGGVLFWTVWFTDKNGSQILIRLKPDNVVVESGTGRLIFIDPN